ncbi:MAG: ABC transporter substrate-binding protein [Zoogloeaceae bacterium]|nr:ABC transporter substrate-binding protein [Rhodocyclaceae bacterium]MCP5236377.1 ABC transporter substrate-binding protein [Zoogloeaceae bacterium]
MQSRTTTEAGCCPAGTEPRPRSLCALLWRWAGAAVVALALAACSEPEPVRIGFVAGISGRGADLGISGRNGAQLAVEQRNRNGGINGRRVELMIRDDGGDPAHARRILRDLAAAGCRGVVGPMTSAIAVALVDEAEASDVVLMSPTATANALSGRDDHFFRVVAPTRTFTRNAARYLADTVGLRRIAAIYDAANAAYAASWLSDFREAFEADGRSMAIVLTFESGTHRDFQANAERMLAESPDGILIVANSLDAALIAQQVRKLDARIPLAASEWAATARLTEMGGRAVEGMTLGSFLDETDTTPAFVAFLQDYVARFGVVPGYGGLTGFDAANTMMDAIAHAAPGQSLRESIRSRPRVSAAQGPFEFDRFGDGQRRSQILTVRNGRFVPVEAPR